jgi:hypothetical protein
MFIPLASDRAGRSHTGVSTKKNALRVRNRRRAPPKTELVAAAYGFPADLTDDQILERLLKLNLERAAAELKASQTKKPKSSRAKRDDEML